MESFEEIVKNCILHKNNDDLFEENYQKLLCCEQVQNLLYYGDKEFVKGVIYVLLKDHSFKQIPPTFNTFKNALNTQIQIQKDKKRIDYRNQKNQLNNNILSLNANISDDNSCTYMDELKSDDNVEENVENKEREEIRQELAQKGFKEKHISIVLKIYDASLDGGFENLHDCITTLKIKENCHNELKILLMQCGKKVKKVRKMISSFFSFSVYEKVVEYLLEANNNKLKISELIIDFNKIRSYLSILVYNDDIKDKTSYIKNCSGSVRSYEKEIHRILSLFKTDNILQLKKELLEDKTPNEFSKIFDIHNVPNIVFNFILLDYLQQNSNEIKPANITKILLPDNTPQETIDNFRKNTLRHRLKEMSEYGFLTIKNEKYSVNIKFLNDKQKNALKYVVPFFCGIYPFSSIGHFLASRLDIKDIFKFEEYNIKNILDDCITFDLLNAINNNSTVKISLKNKNTDEKIEPKELILDKEKSLLKIKAGNETEYYLKEIDEIHYDNKSQNPIFSEIYSFYYKIFEELINEYKNGRINNTQEILKKYGTNDTPVFWNKIDERILKFLSKLKFVSVPLTTLELRWLKTIMQDPRFDLFVSEKEKQNLNELVFDVQEFDLSSYKIFNYKENKYTNIINENLVRKIKEKDIEKIRKLIKELNSVTYSLKEQWFKNL